VLETMRMSERLPLSIYEIWNFLAGTNCLPKNDKVYVQRVHFL